MVTAAWVLIGIILVVLLNRLILWFMIKRSAKDVDLDEAMIPAHPKPVMGEQLSVEGGSTGIQPGGVSWTAVPQAGGALIPSQRRGFGFKRKK